MIDINPISFYLSLKIDSNIEKKMLKFSQFIYIEKIL